MFQGSFKLASSGFQVGFKGVWEKLKYRFKDVSKVFLVGFKEILSVFQGNVWVFQGRLKGDSMAF